MRHLEKKKKRQTPCSTSARRSFGRLHSSGAYLESLLGGQHFTKALAGANAQRVAQEANLLDVVHRDQRGNVRLDVLGGVELEPLALEGEDLGIGHFAGGKEV
jgi:hypothetical protein